MDPAIAISILSLFVAAASLTWSVVRSRKELTTDVRVLAWHDGMGMDVYSADRVETEHVVAVRVVNHGSGLST